MLSRYEINRDGTIYDKKKGENVPYSFNKRIKRWIVNLYTDDGKRKSFTVSKLIADKYLEGTGDRVAYKDGDYNNLSADNLYWLPMGTGLKNYVHKFRKIVRVNPDGTEEYFDNINELLDKYPDLIKGCVYNALRKGVTYRGCYYDYNSD